MGEYTLALMGAQAETAQTNPGKYEEAENRREGVNEGQDPGVTPRPSAVSPEPKKEADNLTTAILPKGTNTAFAMADKNKTQIQKFQTEKTTPD